MKTRIWEIREKKESGEDSKQALGHPAYQLSSIDIRVCWDTGPYDKSKKSE